MNTNVNGIKLYFDCVGQGAPVVLLHGNGEDHTIFDKLTEQLSKHYRVYAIDSRGHGRSSAVSELHYADMAEDIAEFIQKLELDKPILYGFSDGGIVGLMITIKYPGLLSKLVVSGVNANSRGLKRLFLLSVQVGYFFTRNPMLKLMLSEPDITEQQLKTIQTPTLLLVGERDIIKPPHTQMIARCIPNSTVRVVKKQDHASYVVHSEELFYEIEEFLKA